MLKRLSPQKGEWINREKLIEFTFEGQAYQGYEGDTITSALWASGEQVLGRSFKYHRPRGVLSFANHDVNIMVTDGIDTNIRADVTQLKAGMQLSVVNTSGGVKQDKKRWLDKISAILPVGFYYKAFYKPKALFPFWENIIRKAAGLGVVNFNYPRQTKYKSNQFTDVLVVGAGLAGITAALCLAKAGVQVVLVDENAQLGGSLNEDFAAKADANDKLQALLTELANYPNLSYITQAYVAGYYADYYLPIITQTGMIRIRAKAVIVATGAFEHPPVFRNNDLPGVMLSTAAQRLMHRYAVKPFDNGLVFTANTQGYRVALDMLKAGVKVAALVDLRALPNTPLADQLKAMGIKIYTGYCVYEAKPSADGFGVSGAIICPYDETNAMPDNTQSFKIDCDGIAMSAGWSPAAALLYQAGTKMRFDAQIQQFVPQQLAKGIFAAGKVNGFYAEALRAQDGERAASEALRYLNIDTPVLSTPLQASGTPSHPYPMVPHPEGKNFIDFDEDIQLKDFANAAQEGFNNIELMKRYTTFGMGPSQGKHANMNAIRVLARICQQPIAKVGSTTARPFYHPTPLGHLAGYGFQPYRTTAMHAWHQQAGAELAQIGVWMRPAYYKQAGISKQEAVTQEVLAVRNAAGLIDVSTLGKIEVHGAQAAEFLERFYTGGFVSQQVGTTRYALALDEAGVMMDDGIVARLAEDVFYLTTSTTNAAMVYREMQRWQQMWQLDITLTNVTGAYAAMNLAGLASTKILEKLVKNTDDIKQLKSGDVCEIKVVDVDARLISVGFVSEVAYEIHVPAKQAMILWSALIEAGKPYQLQPFGTEAQRILRLEMGHALIGHDTDGLTNPFEANVAFALKMQKSFFVGQRSLKIIKKKTANKILVAFALVSNQAKQTPQECNLVIEQDEIAGRVTSIAWSPTLQKIIGLAYVKPNQADMGTYFDIRTDNCDLVQAQVVQTPFIQHSSGAV
ncbi:MAG: 2Fe-2S iron-sulfur cluster-binding protein [Methylophilus sp.]|nr:2Fe-2S iron-sulfur cluster-binding protein [Methylophilus sp.]